MKQLTEQPFIDEVEVRAKAGRGGDGCVHFRREAYVPKGGPDGGDGGHGGDVVLVGSPHINTLNALRRRRHLKARSGRPGDKQRMTGASGDDLVVDVPVGTMVFDAATGRLLADLTVPGQRAVVAAGGRGGLGNCHFKSSTNRVPRRATPGKEGEELELRLELRLLADVGLVGFPNAGKSSMVRYLTRARPKVADYPFTTLVPNLGVVEDPMGDGFVIADVPGLIEGASEGAGLGHRFLRHLGRNRVLVLVLDAGWEEPEELCRRHDVLLHELAAAPEAVAAPVSVVALNKADLRPAEEREAVAGAVAAHAGVTTLWTSTATGEGMEELKRTVMGLLAAARRAEAEGADPTDDAAPAAGAG